MREAKIDLAGCRMLELGNQILRQLGAHSGPAKSYFTGLGVYHTSVDINGQDGALCLDLQEPLNIGEFDVVTNFGTSEHVPAQFPTFKNMHEACRVEGLMIHVVPSIANLEIRRPHGLWLYKPEFFLSLAKMCKYKILSQEIRPRKRGSPILAQAFVAYIKSAHPFPELQQFSKIGGIVEDARVPA